MYSMNTPKPKYKNIKSELHDLKSQIQNLKNEVKDYKEEMEERPWGGYVVLMDNEKFKVKKLIINPKKRFSLQYHKKRTETWTVVKGKLEITVGDNKEIYTYGESVSVPAGTTHRIENIGKEPAEIIEVQTGTYFGEDDIVRLEDDFGRISK